MTLSKIDEMRLEDWARSESPRRMRGIRRAAESWGAAYYEIAAIDAVVAALRKRGATLHQCGENHSFYGKLADGRDVRIADHLGYESHDVEITIDMPMTRTRFWQYVAEELKN